MLSELRKSTNAIMFERVTSPFFGTLITSWLIWNWKIVYVTLFISESKIEGTKIEYIQNHYCDLHILITFPIISTIILITLIPFISNGAFWLSMKFKKWRIDQKNEIEKKQLLTIEQSIAIRTELREKEIEFEKILAKKSQEAEGLNVQIKDLEERLETMDKTLQKKGSKNGPGANSYSSQDYIEFKNNKKAFEPFEKIASSIRISEQFPKDVDSSMVEYYLLNDIVEEKGHYDGHVFYVLTFKGRNLYRDFFNEQFETE